MLACLCKRGLSESNIDTIYEKALSTDFDYRSFVELYETELEKIPLSRQELHRLLFYYIKEAPPRQTLGGCQICMQPLGKDEDIFTLPGCCHLLHKTCFLENVTSSLSCPVCKRNVRLGLLQAVCEKDTGRLTDLNNTLDVQSTIDEYLDH